MMTTLTTTLTANAARGVWRVSAMCVAVIWVVSSCEMVSAGFIPSRLSVVDHRHNDWTDRVGWLTESSADQNTQSEARAGAVDPEAGEHSQSAPFPEAPWRRGPADERSLVGLPPGSSDSGSSGSGSGGHSRSLSSVPLLSTPITPNTPLLVTRFDAAEDIRLPQKLPDKLFRPPRLF